MKNICILAITLFISSCSANTWLGEKERNEKLVGERISALTIDDKAFGTNSNQAVHRVDIPAQASVHNWLSSSANHNMLPGNIKLAKSNGFITKHIKLESVKVSIPPIIVGDKIFVLDDNKVLTAYSITDKNLISTWRKDVNSTGNKEPSLGGGLTYKNGVLVITGGHREVIALDANKGKERWRRNIHNISRRAPYIYNEMVFVTTLDNRTYAINLEDGAINWTHQGAGDKVGLVNNINLAAKDGVIFIPYNGGEIYSLAYGNGQEIWLASLDNIIPYLDNNFTSSVLLTDNKLVICEDSGRVIALDQTNGRVIWTKLIGKTMRLWQAGAQIFAMLDTGDIMALASDDGTIIWQNSLIKNLGVQGLYKDIKFSNMIMAGDKLIMATSNGKLLMLSAINGNVVSIHDIYKGEPTNIVVVDDNILIFYKNGQASLLK
jgi:outer membrane protein assembly factor BamB